MNEIVNLNNINYKKTLSNLILRIKESRFKMLKQVSSETILLYWNIGITVSEKVQNENWGKSVVEKLSKDLQSEFPGVRGFSSRNIWRMKNLVETYSNSEFLPPLVAEIGWTQNYIIIEKCKNEQERAFYLLQSKRFGWSKNDLLEKIKSHFFENQILSQNNFSNTINPELKADVAWEFIDDYSVEIINPDQPISEKTMENSIIKNIVKFLDSMGGSFAFVGRQYKVEFREKEYFIDLLFFNFQLNCYVVFELKAREFSPKDLGQLQMYLLAVNEKVKKSDHNPSIGILICRDKDRVIIEYLLNAQNQPMGVATYNKFHHLNEVPKEIAKYLPSEIEINEKLGVLIEHSVTE